MGEHRHNPVAKANAVPQKMIRVALLGDDFVLANVILDYAISDDGVLHICVAAIGGKRSDLVPLIPQKLILGELAAVPLDKLREGFAGLLKEQEEAEQQTSLVTP